VANAPPTAAAPSSPTPIPIDRRLFQGTALWSPVPVATDAVRAIELAEAIERPRLHLVGIIIEGATRSAALIHADTHELLIVSVGARIDPFTVSDITEKRVTLTHAGHREEFLVHREEAP
jgi:hypothetical protein